jgi:fatty acid desaturase
VTELLSPDIERGSAYSALCREVRARGLLDRQHAYYVRRITLTLIAFVAVWTIFGVLGNSWWQLLVAVPCGLLFTQLAFFGHDGGHQQVCNSRRGNDLIGLLFGDLLVGLSFGWWVDKHNRHHAHPNQEDHDPDIGEGVLAFTSAQVANRHGALSRFVARNQAWLFFPMLAFEGFQLHVASARSLLLARGRRHHRSELILFATHLVLYLGALFTVLPPAKAIAVLIVHQVVFGIYMGSCFAPNHKGMAIIGPDEKVDYLRRQVLTSRNISGGWFMDFLLGGLNNQIEHHLFPSMPRPNQPRARKLVLEYCAEHGIKYAETTLFGSFAIVLRYLHQIGRPLRSA